MEVTAIIMRAKGDIMREDVSKKRFIEETYRLISTEGEGAVSIRRIGREMNCNTANIYRYFKDLDELVTYASLRYLAGYLEDVAKCYEASESTLETYLMVWDCFAGHAFDHPQLFDKLFFGRHSRQLEEIIREYYALFPEDMAGIAPALEEVFTTGSFDRRDFLMISRCVADGWFTADEAKYLNTLLIHLFMGFHKELLDRERTEEEVRHLRHSFISCVHTTVEHFCRKRS